MTDLDPTPAVAEFDADRFDRLKAFADRFRPVFPRADQFRRFVLYLAGLVAPGGRKNVEAVAAGAAGLGPGEADLVQALQHFVTGSPWDADRLFAAVRAARPADPGAVWVVHDAVFPKKGRHSAGVQRQYARSLGQKVNCQIAVVLSQAGPAGYVPLAARLYLPGHWLRENPALAERIVPEDHRRPRSKGEIGLELVDAVLADGRRPGRGAVVLEDGYATAEELTGGLPARELTTWGPAADNAAAALADARRGVEDLRRTVGLDHFEGRTWAGWHHHVSLAFAAAAFLATEPPGLIQRHQDRE